MGWIGAGLTWALVRAHPTRAYGLMGDLSLLEERLKPIKGPSLLVSKPNKG